MAAVVSQTGLSADVDRLPSWETLVRGMDRPGCVVHFRRVAGPYASREYRLRYSRAAKASIDAWKALVYNVLVTVTRPVEGGGDEVLPERLGVRAVCAMPDTRRGTTEATGRVEAILEAHGLAAPGTGEARIPSADDGRWALAPLLWAGEWLGPQPLRAAQAQPHDCTEFPNARECPMEDLKVTVHRPVTCPVGFDYEMSSGDCVLHSIGGEGNSGPANPGSGSGGGGGEGEGETEPRAVAFTLSCPAVTRGTTGRCAVSAPDSAGVSLGALKFAWSAATGGAEAGAVGKSSWSGTAVMDVDVTVTVSDPAGAIAGATETETAAVTARTWSFAPPTPASASSGYAGAGWTPGRWGQHDSGSTTHPGVAAGSGPWEGTYMGDDPPVHDGGNWITLHYDFDPHGSPHPGANHVPCFAATSSGTLANVVDVNAKCGTAGALSAWEAQVLAHERAHAASGDRCLRSATTGSVIRKLEQIMGTDVDKVRKQLYDTWNDFWTKKVLDAFGGGLPAMTSPVMWEYRFKGSWNLHALRSAGEGGTNGC